MKYKCNICLDEGRVEIDPRYPEQASTPQYEICECKIREVDDVIED